MNPTAIRRFAAVSLGVVTAGFLAVGSQAKDETKTTEATMEIKAEATTTASTRPA